MSISSQIINYLHSVGINTPQYLYLKLADFKVRAVSLTILLYRYEQDKCENDL